jgi:hypothetical protein
MATQLYIEGDFLPLLNNDQRSPVETGCHNAMIVHDLAPSQDIHVIYYMSTLNFSPNSATRPVPMRSQVTIQNKYKTLRSLAILFLSHRPSQCCLSFHQQYACY